MNETREGQGTVWCQGGGAGFWPCPDRAHAAVVLTTLTGARLPCCDLCGRAIYDMAPSEYQLDPLFTWADPYDDARMAAGLPAAGLPQQLAAPTAQSQTGYQGAGQLTYQGQPQGRGLLGMYRAWKASLSGGGQLGMSALEASLIGGIAWEIHEHEKETGRRLTNSVMGRTMPDGVTPRHPHGYGSVR